MEEHTIPPQGFESADERRERTGEMIQLEIQRIRGKARELWGPYEKLFTRWVNESGEEEPLTGEEAVEMTDLLTQIEELSEQYKRLLAQYDNEVGPVEDLNVTVG
jgi:transposase